MDYFSAMQAITAIQTIKNGGVADLSLAQISNCIINLPDADHNLSRVEFEKVYSLFLKYQRETAKKTYNISSYTETTIAIIRTFDAIAPYELYSGGDPGEFSTLLKEIRQSKPLESAPSILPKSVSYAPPKKIGLSFWLLIIAAVGAVIAIAIYFNR